MNVSVAPPPNGVARHKITLAEARRMWAVEGELFEMPSDGVVTISWNVAIARWLYASIGPDFVVVPDKTLPVTETPAPKPDFYVYPASIPLADVTAANASLVIEISDSTLGCDRDVKAPLYAQGGVRDYWIVNGEKRKLLVFRPRADGTFGDPTVYEADQRAEARLISSLALRLNDLHLPD